MTTVGSAPVSRPIPRWAWLTVGVMAIAAWVVIQHAGRGTGPFYDDWTFVTTRRGLSAKTLLSPHVGHLVVIPVLIYKTLLALFGITHYWAFRAVLGLLTVLCGLLIFRFAAVRGGPAMGLFAAGLVFVLGSAGDDLIWAFQMSFMLSVSSGIIMLSALGSRRRGAPIVVGIALAVSLASSGLGVVFLATSIVFVAFSRRRDQMVAIAVPAVAYAAWYLGYGESVIQRSNADIAVPYAANMAAAGMGGITGLGVVVGMPLLVIGVIAAVWTIGKRTHVGPELAALIAAPLIFWGITALSRAQLGEPEAPRYIYPSAVFIILLAVELLRGRSIPARGIVLGAGLVSLAVIANIGKLDATATNLRAHRATLDAQVAAVDLATTGGTVIPGGFVPAPGVAPQLNVELLRNAEASFGRLVSDPAAVLAAATPEDLAAADRTLADGGQLATASGSLAANKRCKATDGRDLTLNPGADTTIRVAEDAALQLRRFGSTFPTTDPRPLPAGYIRITAGEDSDPRPWHLQVDGTTQLATCS